MKFLALFLISLPVYSNSFKLPDTGSRFSLKISASELVYESEGMRKTFALKDCNIVYARQLNAELIKKLPKVAGTQGLKFIVDDKTFFLDPKSDLASTVTMMDPRIQQFSIEEREACK